VRGTLRWHFARPAELQHALYLRIPARVEAGADMPVQVPSLVSLASLCYAGEGTTVPASNLAHGCCQHWLVTAAVKPSLTASARNSDPVIVEPSARSAEPEVGSVEPPTSAGDVSCS